MKISAELIKIARQLKADVVQFKRPNQPLRSRRDLIQDMLDKQKGKNPYAERGSLYKEMEGYVEPSEEYKEALNTQIMKRRFEIESIQRAEKDFKGDPNIFEVLVTDKQLGEDIKYILDRKDKTFSCISRGDNSEVSSLEIKVFNQIILPDHTVRRRIPEIKDFSPVGYVDWLNKGQEETKEEPKKSKKKYLLNLAYEKYNRRSEHTGEGFEFQNESYDSLWEMASDMRDWGKLEASSNVINKNTFYDVVEPEYFDEERVNYTYLPVNLTDAEAKKLHKYIEMTQTEFNKARPK